MKLTPTRIEPIFSPRIWGARSLAPLYPEKSNLAEPLGEAWLSGVDCRIASGPYTGKTLGEAWTEMPAEWRGGQLADVADFPLLVKFIFPTDQLSIQVHPDDAYASVNEKAAGGRGKTEMWHVVSAEAGARVLVGLDPKVDEENLRELLGRDTLENLFIHWRVQPGDTFFVPAGTPHTIGKDMVICEVQQYSDLTYRIYDYRRLDAQGNPRELHIEKALDVIRFGRTMAGKASRMQLSARGFERVLLAACPYFATELWKNFRQIETQAHPRHFDLLVILSGSGQFVWSDGSAEYHRGECWLIPAGLGTWSLNSAEPSKVLRTYVPDLPALRAGLERDGHSWRELKKTVFD